MPPHLIRLLHRSPTNSVPSCYPKKWYDTPPAARVTLRDWKRVLHGLGFNQVFVESFMKHSILHAQLLVDYSRPILTRISL